MDLLACDRCGHRYYVPGTATPERRRCVHCGGQLGVSLHDIARIPLDAIWLDGELSPVERPPVTVVHLQRKRKHGGWAARRIIKELGDYFDVSAEGRSVEVSVNRGSPEVAPMRVAAILDGVDSGWERHLYLVPTLVPTDSQAPPDDSDGRSRVGGGRLRLVPAWGRRGPGAEG